MATGRQLVVIVAATALILGGCSAPSSDPLASRGPASVAPSPSVGPAAVASGIDGVTEADPQCPIVAPGAVCPPKTISATIAVLDSGGSEVTTFTSGSDGLFRVALAPGTYTLVEVVASAGLPPSLRPVSVEVNPGRSTHVVLLFDTGIR